MKISLVVPLRDEEQSIRGLLVSISKQTLPPEEVVFVDAGSVDKTRDIINEFKEERFDIRLISMGRAYPGAARNEGVRNARHEVIAFTDGGIELDRNWLWELSRPLIGDAPVDVVYGSYTPKTDTLFKECLALAVVPPALLSNGERARSHFIASSILKKSVWKNVGGFPNLRAAEDRIFMERVNRKGFRLAYRPQATVVWDIPGDFKGVFARFYSYSYHDLKGRRGADWHLPVLKMYLVGLFFVYLGFFASSLFFYLPILGFATRAGRKIAINKNEPYFRWGHIPLYMALTPFLILFVDAAMFAGWIRFLGSKVKKRAAQ